MNFRFSFTFKVKKNIILNFYFFKNVTTFFYIVVLFKKINLFEF